MLENNELTIDDVFSMAAERGLKSREWIWKPLQPYNGYTSEQRIRAWRALHLAIQLGLISPANLFPCDICGTTDPKAGIGYHSEDYSSMTGNYPLCKSCHTTLHQRNRFHKAWRELLDKYGNSNHWYEKLS
jgi:hypothetical protein